MSILKFCQIEIAFNVLFLWLPASTYSMQVVLAANDLPSINDVTYSELIEIISTVTHKFGSAYFWYNQNSFLFLSRWLPVKGWRRVSLGCQYFKSYNCQLWKWFTCKKIKSNFFVILGKSLTFMMIDYMLLCCFVRRIAGYWSYKSITRGCLPCQWCRSCHFRRDGKFFLWHIVCFLQVACSHKW